MKKLLIIGIVLVSLFSCKKAAEFTKFDIENNTESVIESVIGINLPIYIPTPIITTNIEQTMEEENSHKDLIEYANLKQLTLSIKSPNSANFDFLNEMEIFIKSDGLTTQKIASIYNIPESGLKQLDLEVVSNLDIQNYIKADEYILEINVKTDGVILQDVTLNVFSKVFVDAKILGL